MYFLVGKQMAVLLLLSLCVAAVIQLASSQQKGMPLCLYCLAALNPDRNRTACYKIIPCKSITIGNAFI